MEKIKIYRIFVSRNKFDEKGKTPNVLKKEIYNKICNECKENFEIKDLQLDHIIPVKIGGHLFEKENLQLLCAKCHHKKTGVDIRVIHILEKIGFFDKVNFYENPDILKEKFNSIKKDLLENNKKKSIWYYGINGVDYYEESYYKNREVQNGNNCR